MEMSVADRIRVLCEAHEVGLAAFLFFCVHVIGKSEETAVFIIFESVKIV